MEQGQELGRSKVLVIGALEHLGTYITMASATKQNFTLVLLSEFVSTDPEKNTTIEEFQQRGIAFMKGSIYDQSKLLIAIQAVDVVIWITDLRFTTMGSDLIAIIEAIKEARNEIKRFVMLGISDDIDRTNVLPAAEAQRKTLCQMRRFIESSCIPYTYIVPNFLAGLIFRRADNELSLPLKIPLYGNGNTKVVFSDEEDVATYTILAADDPRTLNKTLYIRSPANVISLNELMSLWENKINRLCDRTYFTEAALLEHYHEAEQRDKVLLALLHSAFIRGDQTNFTIEQSFGQVASDLYPNVQYTTMETYLNRFLPH